jgi:hypothetical protein
VVDLQFNYPQWLAHEALAPRRSIFYGWGRGVGKSKFVRSCWWLQVAKHDGKLRTDALKPFRGVRIIMFMPTLVQAKDVHLGGIEDEIGHGGEWAFLGAKIDRQRMQVQFPGGSWIKTFPASNYNSRTSRGMRCDIISGDEIDDIDADVYDGVAVPWLSEPWSLGIELLGGTPTRGRHGLWYRMLTAGKLGEGLRSGEMGAVEALETPAAKATIEIFNSLPAHEWPAHLPRDPELATLEILKGYYSFHATYRDAPETVSAVAVARAKATTPDATFKREWLADPDAGEGLVYPFVATPDAKGFCHVQEPPPLSTFREFHVGMDHGYSDPGVLLLCGVQGHGEDATLWVLDEHYEREVPNYVWNDRAKNWSFAKFWPDPSRPDRVNDIRCMGIEVGDVDNDILAGIARLANLMFVRETEGGQRYARFYVSPKCKNTIAEFGKYRRKKLPDGSFDEKPEDKWNHAMDSARYVAVGRFGRMPNTRHVSSGR